jgi:hypothetical protein
MATAAQELVAARSEAFAGADFNPLYALEAARMSGRPPQR